MLRGRDGGGGREGRDKVADYVARFCFFGYTGSKPNEFEIVDKNDLYERIAGNRRLPRKPVEFVFEARKSSLSPREPQALYSYAIGNVRAVNFRASATQVCDLLKKENDTNGTDTYLFEENIRSFLNLRAKPNKKMKETLESPDAVYFPFFNNGITMVAERLEIPLSAQYGSYLIKILNPQIVNGLQTTKVLQSVYASNAEALNGVDVNIRIYETNDKNLIEKITDATNTQSPINFKDKLSTSEFLKNLKMLFSNNGINLIVKRGEQFELSGTDEPRASVSSETVIKFWYATYFERPEVAKNSISSVLQQFYDGMNAGNEILSSYFSDMDGTPLYGQMLAAYRIYAVVQREKKIHAAEEFVKSSDELLCYGIFKEYKKSGGTECTDDQIDCWYARAFTNVKELIEKSKADYESDGRTFSYNTFLKNAVCRAKYDAAYGGGTPPA